MDVRVEPATEPPSVGLDEPEDCTRFQVTVVGGSEHFLVARALVSSGMGRLHDNGSHASISVDAVRSKADGRVGPEWSAAFEAMISYAATKGWLSPGGEEIRAHVEWPA